MTAIFRNTQKSIMLDRIKQEIDKSADFHNKINKLLNNSDKTTTDKLEAIFAEMFEFNEKMESILTKTT